MSTAKPASATKKRSTKASDGNREYALMLYMQRVSQNDIADRCGVSIQTISDWKKKDSWEAKRAAKTISMDELIVKALRRINEMLDEEDFNADAFAKAVAQLKSLKQQNTVDDEIMCFMEFQNWMLERRAIEGIDQAFIKQVTRLQDGYIKQRLGNA
jgi:transcriptional regulator with XRE-family HTH domain